MPAWSPPEKHSLSLGHRVARYHALMQSRWRRGRIGGAILLAALSLLGAALVWVPFGNRVTRGNCERIKEGMTEAEVRAILGKPWDDSLLDPEPSSDVVHSRLLYERLQEELLDSAFEQEHQTPKSEYYQLWVGKGFVIWVAFDDNKQVAFSRLFTDPDLPQTTLPVRIWRRLRPRLGW